MNNIINVNRKTRLEEVKNFFQVMEVYGETSDLWVRITDFSNDSFEFSG